MGKKIPVSGPWITQKEINYVADAAAKAWYENANLYNARFEKAFAEYLAVKHAVSLPSCTSAIHLSLVALGVGPGDEVIVPDITWIATAAPISYVGASPVFADIDPQHWCLAADSLEACITSRTKAVIAVDLYGNVPDWDAVLAVARKHDIAVIEDAAEAIGSEYKHRKAGTFGATAAFSFHGSKTLTTGEGGMLVTDDTEIYERVLFLRDHGRKPGDVMFYNTEVAFKYRMSSLQAALGLAQIERIEELVGRKRQIFGEYAEALQNVDGLTLNYEAPETRNTYWMVTAVLESRLGIEKSHLMRLMAGKNIDCRPFFFPLSMIPAYQDREEARKARARNLVSYAISPYGINLPSGMNMDAANIGYVCDVLKEAIAAPDLKESCR
ncbi:MAG: DegT/DnrJ/EryC1/StrS family aminotransferase [Desulfobacterales bacterium]|nr:MAG: DegT/DnrJ/EryC1/StrS family aminotransferase [Desulfobacterales bacterium]